MRLLNHARGLGNSIENSTRNIKKNSQARIEPIGNRWRVEESVTYSTFGLFL